MVRTNLGKLLRDLREANNLTQKELASQLQTSQRLISYWETGRQKPQIEELDMLAKFFDISLEELLEALLNKN